MFVFVLTNLFVVYGLSFDSEMSDMYDTNVRTYKTLRAVQEINLTDTYFSSLENYQSDADQVDEQDYPWIARVIHSRSHYIPHVCTAVCIDPAIFITAARCIYTLKVNYTSIIYKSKRLHALAFVLPTEMTKQGFDDIGFIVVRSKNVKGEWSTIKPFNTKRTDNSFAWFANFSSGNIKSRVVGYAAKKGIHKFWVADKEFNLTALDVVVGLDICPKILTDRKIFKAFFVPCYYSCSITALLRNKNVCKKYHGVEGGAVFDTLTKQLMGVATWGSYSTRLELPVGFAFANSLSFMKDYICAKLIRDDSKSQVKKGYYQSLCSPL